MSSTNLTPQAAQVAPAKKAAKLKADSATGKPPPWLNATAKARRAARKAEREREQHDQLHVRSSRAPPGVPRLLDRHQVCEICGVTYQIIWRRMRSGTFPRSRIVGGRSMWLSDEVEAWLRALPVRPLKGDAATEETSP